MTCPSLEALSQTGTCPTTNLSFGRAEATILQKMLLYTLHHLESPGNATFLSPSITEERNLRSPERQNFLLSPHAMGAEMGETELSPLCNTLGFYNPPSSHTLCFWELTHSLPHTSSDLSAPLRGSTLLENRVSCA